MIDHELTDPTGSALTITHNADGVWVTATDTRDEVTVGPFPTRVLRASFDMGDDLLDGGVTAAAIENEVVSPERARSLVQERDEWKARFMKGGDLFSRERTRAEQAEQELDRLRAVLATTARQRDEADRNTRPVAVDHITDEMVRKLRREGDLWTSVVIPSDAVALALLTAALTEPPSRPDGAEEIEDLLADWFGESDSPDKSNHELADYLVRKGVRVTEERS